MNETEDYRATSVDESDSEDPRLMDAVREYQAALDNGSRPSRAEFLARYADIRADLAECLDGLEFLHSAAPRLQPPPAAIDAVAPLQPDGTLGDFRLVREIGRGGMGVVYEAVQISLARRVALKVLPFAATLDSRQLQRFENEARAAAHLHHANIVPVFAVGSERGVHYYAMQLIDGRTLADVIDHLRQVEQGERPFSEPKREDAPLVPPSGRTVAGAESVTQQSVGSKTFFRTVALLGVQVADALDYAHQMGVVHRDIKPANLLIDGRDNLWVTDFGLSRFQANPAVTASGDLVGTLRYMSPEQAAGKPMIDPRSDVYSLGATLYELLTQQPAFTSRDRQECLRQVLDEEPPPPHKLNKALPPELETIVLKAMAKQPEERYNSARELADDLRRFLEDRPVLAQRPGMRERIAKWGRRHRRVVASAVLGLMAAVLVLGVALWFVFAAKAEAEQEKQRTDAALVEGKWEQLRTIAALAQKDAAIEQKDVALEAKNAALEQEATQRDRAEANYSEARKVLDRVTKLGMGELGKGDLANNTAAKAVRRQLLTDLLAYYDWFIEQYRDDATISEELIESQVQVAELLDQIGKKAESQAAFQKAWNNWHHCAGTQGRPFPGSVGGSLGSNRGLPNLLLLAQPAVQQDMKLSREQKSRLTPFATFQPGRQPADPEKALVEIRLTSDQNERLLQLSRQTRGPHALLDPETVRALDLSEKQQKDIQLLLLPKREAWVTEGPKTPSPITLGPKEKREPGRRIVPGFNPFMGQHSPVPDWKQLNEQVLKVLTSEQRTLWDKMLGPPLRTENRFGPMPHGR